MRQLTTALILSAASLLAFGVPPAQAQVMCQQITSVTTRTSSGFALTPLDAIAFPVMPTPGSLTVVRQVTICPSVAVPPISVPIISPSFPAVFPVAVPTQIVIGTPGVFPDPPAGPSSPTQTSPPISFRPSEPAVIGRAPQDTVRDLAGRSGDYDRQVVSVTGTVAAVERGIGPGGHPITVFELAAEGASIHALAWGRPLLKVGDQVRVTGPFYVSTPFAGPSGASWHKVIEAESLER